MRVDKLFVISNICLSLLAVSCVGSTFAWYQYMIRASINYEGASIGNTELLDIGLISDVELKDHEEYFLKQDPKHSNIYWSNGAIDSKVLNYYLKSNGYASNSLIGVTSGKYSLGDKIHFKNSPSFLNDYSDSLEASKDKYAHVSLAFRTRSVTSPDVGVAKKRISLRKCDVLSEGNLSNSMRIYMETNDNDKFIFNPSIYETGSTTVGGILDLNEDKFFDYESIQDPTSDDGYRYQEYTYGQHELLVYKEVKTSIEEENLDDKEMGNTFSGTHKSGVYAVDTEQSIFSEAETYGMQELIDKRKTLVLTDEFGFGSLDLSIYLEGWDKSFINNELGSKFNLDMEFEIN